MEFAEELSFPAVVWGARLFESPRPSPRGTKREFNSRSWWWSGLFFWPFCCYRWNFDSIEMLAACFCFPYSWASRSFRHGRGTSGTFFQGYPRRLSSIVQLVVQELLRAIDALTSLLCRACTSSDLSKMSCFWLEPIRPLMNLNKTLPAIGETHMTTPPRPLRPCILKVYQTPSLFRHFNTPSPCRLSSAGAPVVSVTT